MLQLFEENSQRNLSCHNQDSSDRGRSGSLNEGRRRLVHTFFPYTGYFYIRDFRKYIDLFLDSMINESQVFSSTNFCFNLYLLSIVQVFHFHRDPQSLTPCEVCCGLTFSEQFFGISEQNFNFF